MNAEKLTTEELALIKGHIRPENKKNSIYVLFGLIVLSLITPFFPGRYTDRPSAYERGEYLFALLISLIVYMSIGIYFYYSTVFLLDKDVEIGLKKIVFVKILSKKKKSDISYEIVLDKGKHNINKIVNIPASDVYKWIKGDLVEVHFLERSKTVLSYKNK